MKNNIIDHWENGNIKCKGKRINGARCGLWTYYYENGIKRKEGLYDGYIGYGEKEGIWTYWNEDGVKTSDVIMPENIQINYYDNGIISSKGKRVYASGRGISWLPSSRESGRGFVFGHKYNRIGNWKYYFENRQIKKVCNYIIARKMSRYNGLVKRYYEDGTKKSEQNYYKGFEYGEEIWWDENGKVNRYRKHNNKLIAIIKKLGEGEVV